MRQFIFKNDKKNKPSTGFPLVRIAFHRTESQSQDSPYSVICSNLVLTQGVNFGTPGGPG